MYKLLIILLLGQLLYTKVFTTCSRPEDRVTKQSYVTALNTQSHTDNPTHSPYVPAG